MNKSYVPTRLPLLFRAGVILFLFFSLLAVINQNVQAQSNSCPAIVQQALSELQKNCTGVGRNSACYGYNLVDSTFAVEVEPGFFSQPADIAELVQLQTIQTAALDIESNHWGVAVMNVQANVPNTLPGQAVTFILMGDTQVENRVAPGDAAPALEPIEVRAGLDAVLRSQPSRNSNAIDILAGELALPADAVDPSGEWVRSAYADRPVWIALTDLVSSTGVDTLPAITPESRSPMQAFYFTTGIGQSSCLEAPDVLTIQGREDILVDLSVNGADIRIGSVIHLKSIGPNRIAMTVSQGHLEVLDTGEITEAGQTIEAGINEDGTIIDWGDPRDWTPEEAALVRTVQNALSTFSGDQVIHIVSAGETLFGIAQLYNASMPEIVEVNGLAANGTIFVGQQLIIPNPGSGFVPLALPPTAPPPPPPPTQTAAVDCTTFSPLSPSDGLVFGTNTFQWTPAPGATSYQVVVSNLENGQTVKFPTVGTETTVTGVLDYNTIGYGYSFSWYVEALLNGVVVCSSRTLTMLREDVASTILTASWGCAAPGVLSISYSGALPGETVTATFIDVNQNTVTLQQTARSGSWSYNLPGIRGIYTAGNGTVFTNTQRVSLSPDPIRC